MRKHRCDETLGRINIAFLRRELSVMDGPRAYCTGCDGLFSTLFGIETIWFLLLMQLQLTLGADRGVQRELRNRHSETEVWTTANVTTVHTRGVMVDSCVWGEEPDKTGLPSE